MALLLIVSGRQTASGITPGVPSLVLTTRENGTEPQQDFTCYGRIHGYLRLPERVEGSHVLESEWKLPNQKVIARSRTEVNFLPPGRSTAYAWFAFADPPSTLGPINPAIDAERLSYRGTWTVQVFWDEKPLVRSTFRVDCP